MSKECWEKCPRVGSILRLGSEVTEYMPPGRMTDNVWAIQANEIDLLSSKCPGPIQVGTRTIETKLPFYHVRRALGITATKSTEMPVYDCAARPISGIVKIQ